MYKRHSIWDEDKWDIHGSGSRGYASHSSGSKEEYHKNEMYNPNKEDALPNEDYRSRDEKEDDRKKKDEEEGRNIVNAVEQEEKYQKKEEQEEGFHAIAKDIHQSSIGNEDAINESNSKEIKKKNNKNIEEAINEAIKEEKEIVHID